MPATQLLEVPYQWDGGYIKTAGTVQRLPNLYAVHNRYYAPEWGRWLQRDPIGIWQDAPNLGNGYTYSASNPASLTDPFGLFTITLGNAEDPLEWRD